jgi:hypothetical protein
VPSARRAKKTATPDAASHPRVEIVNRLPAGGSARWDVVLTYGGAVYEQRFLTRRLNAHGSFSYLVLPMQYAGDPAAPSSNHWTWRDYHSAKWFDYANGPLGTYKNADAFDNNCAGCHFTGSKLTGDATDGWAAHAVAAPMGEIDLDGDGRKEA